jgi:hypothetical protein
VDSAETLAQYGYPAVRNLVIFTSRTLQFAEKTAGKFSLAGLPVHLVVGGMAAFLQENLAHIVGVASTFPELNALIEHHLKRLEDDHRRKAQNEKVSRKE